MAKPTTRAEFKEYCLRKLGKPVIDINVDEDQVEDRIDEAISFWRDYHYDGTELVYYKHQLTADDITNGFVIIPDDIIGVVRLINMGSALLGSGMFNVQYQYMLNNITTLNSGGLSDYVIMRTNLSLIEEVFSGKPIMRFNRHTNRLFFDTGKVVEGNWVVIEAYSIIDADAVWNDRWLQNYATCLIKENWGANITKFVGFQMQDGRIFNGEQILQDAVNERRKLEDEVINGFSPLIRNFYG